MCAAPVLTAGTGTTDGTYDDPPTVLSVEPVPLGTDTASGVDHPNIVKVTFKNEDGTTYERYVVFSDKSTFAYSFGSLEEATNYINYASILAGNAIVPSGSSWIGKSHMDSLGSFDLFNAAGMGDNMVSESPGDSTVTRQIQITINGQSYQLRRLESSTHITEFSQKNFAGDKIPGFTDGSQYYLKRPFDTSVRGLVPNAVQLAGLQASANDLYADNGYATQSPLPNKVDVAQEVKDLIKLIFGDVEPNEGHLNVLGMLGLAKSDGVSGDNHAGWSLTDQGRSIIPHLNAEGVLKGDMQLLPTLSMAGLQSSMGFGLETDLTSLIKLGEDGKYSFQTKSDGKTATTSDVSAALRGAYEYTFPPGSGIIPESIPSQYLPLPENVQKLGQDMFGTSSLNAGHINVLLASGLVRIDSSSTPPSLQLTDQGNWLATQGAPAPGGDVPAPGNTKPPLEEGLPTGFIANVQNRLGSLADGGKNQAWRSAFDNAKGKNHDDGYISREDLNIMARRGESAIRYTPSDKNIAQANLAKWIVTNWENLKTLASNMIKAGLIAVNPFEGDGMVWADVEAFLAKLPAVQPAAT